MGFNTQPRGGGCLLIQLKTKVINNVSTHSRAEAAAKKFLWSGKRCKVSTHSRAEAAANDGFVVEEHYYVSTHSRAEAAAPYIKKQEKSAN